ncbi:MAG TPA: hypothetical protein VH418_13440 [Solirubrobacteraceae bacterium]|jgi:hypothetical protein
MHQLRMAALAAVMTCALVLAGAGAASAAQQPAKLARKVAVTGTHGFKGKLTINRFVTRHGKVYAVGRLVGRLHGKRVSRYVRVPAKTTQGAASAQLPPIPNACQILNLQLGPINLNLLGLSVRTNRINLRIDAVPGAGNLLGNLLCAVTNLLNPSTATPAQLSRVLNALLALV